MNIVAEGVETFEELAYLRASTTIRQVQGFYFARPFHPDSIDSVRHLFPVRHQASMATSPRPIFVRN
jgi:EAL domain-containing protein (putative c-di-GMP-specific phosphodiesterase class I)